MHIYLSPSQLYSLQRDYRVLKAAYNKLLKECDEQKSELTLTTEVRDRVLNEQKSVADAHHLQETRMQSTIEQQSKLIDYMHASGTTPRVSGLGKLAKVHIYTIDFSVYTVWPRYMYMIHFSVCIPHSWRPRYIYTILFLPKKKNSCRYDLARLAIKAKTVKINIQY